MLLKWIRCRVPEASRPAFSRAQAAWSAIAGTEGLLGQAGGFDTQAPDTACVAALWSGDDAYRRFVAEVHDRVVAASGQAGTYAAIEVGLYDERFPMPGAKGDLAAALGGAALLRVAECRVRPGHEAHFESVQAGVWRPAMAEAPGMLGGSFLSGPGGTFLVVTAWADAASHDAYAREAVAGLRARAGAGDDLAALVGRRVVLEPTWSAGLAPAPPLD